MRNIHEAPSQPDRPADAIRARWQNMTTEERRTILARLDNLEASDE